MADPRRNAERIKATAYYLGGDAVGLCAVPSWAYYSHDAGGNAMDAYHANAINLLIDQGHETMEGASGDDWISVAQSMRAYLRFSLLGGIVVDSPSAIADSYATGRGSFRVRAKWALEDQGRGTWQIVVTEIPYQVQKAKLIERLAELIETKKVPALADVRDESAEDVRIVLEPRARTVEPAQLMGMLFRNSELEVRFSLNMNVLIDGRVPKVCSLKEVLRAFLAAWK